MLSNLLVLFLIQLPFVKKAQGKDFEDEARKTLLCSAPEERTVNTSLSPSEGPSETTAADVLPVDYI